MGLPFLFIETKLILMNPKIAVVILAAGLGTRMKSNKAKVLHEVCGKPMINYVAETARKIAGNNVVLVVGNLSLDDFFAGAKGRLNVVRVGADGEAISERVYSGVASNGVIALLPLPGRRTAMFNTKGWDGKRAIKRSKSYDPREWHRWGSLEAVRRFVLDEDGTVVDD